MTHYGNVVELSNIEEYLCKTKCKRKNKISSRNTEVNGKFLVIRIKCH
jgi:hypothetical protein